MIHRGEIVRKEVKESGIKIRDLARRLKVSRNTVYNKFDDALLDLDFIKEIGKIINYDFSKQIKDLSYLVDDISVTPSSLEEPTPEYQSLSECAKALLNLQRKYIALLEKHNDLLTNVKFANR